MADQEGKEPQEQKSRGLIELITQAKAALILVGMVAAGVVWFENRYANAQETARKFEELQRVIVYGQRKEEIRFLESQRRGLQRELSDYQIKKDRLERQGQGLSELEEARMTRIVEDIRDIEKELADLKRPKQEEKK